jgi:O-antigen ligase
MHWLLIGYMFLYIHRPFEVWPALGDIRLELLYMLVMGIVWLAYPDKRWLGNPLHPAIAVFAAAIGLCWLASPFSGETYETVDKWFKMLVFYLMLVTVVHDEASLKKIVFAFLVVMSVYMLHSLWEYGNGRHEYRMSIVRMLGVDRSLGDPNSFAASVLYALPLVVPFWCCYPSKPMRGFLAGYVGLSAVCIVLTGSRAAFLGLVIFGGVTVWYSQRRTWAVIAGLVAVPVLWAAVPGTMQSRFETIVNPAAGPANAKESAQGRLDGLYLGFELWAANPITGCGPGAWRYAARVKLESHNLYGQIVGETGVVGLTGFLALLAGFWVNLRRARSIRAELGPDDDPFLSLLVRAIGVAVFLMLVEGNFGHNLYRFTWLWYAGFLLIAVHCLRQRLEPEYDESPPVPSIADEGLVPWMSTPL